MTRKEHYEVREKRTKYQTALRVALIALPLASSLALYMQISKDDPAPSVWAWSLADNRPSLTTVFATGRETSKGLANAADQIAVQYCRQMSYCTKGQFPFIGDLAFLGVKKGRVSPALEEFTTKLSALCEQKETNARFWRYRNIDASRVGTVVTIRATFDLKHELRATNAVVSKDRYLATFHVEIPASVDASDEDSSRLIAYPESIIPIPLREST